LRPIRNIALAATTIALASLGLLASWVDSPQDLVLLRNALIFDLGSAGVYAWTPDRVPADYRSETLTAPDQIRQFAVEATSDTSAEDDFAVALSLARALSRNRVSDGGPIQSSTLTALARITRDGAGFCSDYTQVFNALSHAIGLPVREWGMSFDGYGGDGHAFNEVWDRKREKWLFLDSFFSFYVVDQQGHPLSATEFRSALIGGTTDSLLVVPIDKAKFGFKTPAKAIEYYQRGANRFFIIWGNDVLSYDENAAVRLFSRVSRAAEGAAAIATGAHPKLLIPSDFVDDHALAELRQLRLLMGVLLLSTVVAITAMLILVMRQR
jgi:transglutaminase-like putative cysteine protease